ncbi:hypothetical protein [Agrococcus sp. DT81.2]|uniref:hypothetical protein n=1 Tax=Agrococcus sp. DT81.2 TaxID=3393414 RepID=UPI003CE4F869
MPSPDFVMPPEAVAPPALPPESAPPEDAGRAHDPTAEPEGAAAAPRMPWRQLIVAGLVGVLIGAALPAGVQAAQDAAAAAQVEALRSTAMAYLTAIAEGDAERATAMVPVDGHMPPDVVLGSAERIEELEVQLVTIEDDVARIDVRFEVGAAEQVRELAAERVDEEWRITTSLAEQVIVHSFDGVTGVTLAGVTLPANRSVVLYPGVYRADEVETPLLRSGGERFEVDGDPNTPSDLFSNPMLTDEFRDAAVDVATARVAACLEQQGCPFDADTAVPPRAELYIMGIDPADGTIDVVVPLGYVGSMGQWQELPLRANVDEAGALVSWDCGQPGRPHHDLEACGP